MKKLFLISLCGFLVGCGGGAGGSSSSATDSKNNESTNISTNYFTETPKLESCFPGSVTEQLKQDALKRINEIRALHNLSEVTYDYSSDNEVMQTALFMVANRSISHNINSNGKCYTELAKAGSANGNLSLKSVDSSVDPLSHITGWMNEKDSPDLAHRRWLLNPFLKKIAFGYSENNIGGRKVVAAALKVIYLDDLKNANNSTGIIAYPMNQDYPMSLFDKDSKLSFSIFDNQLDFWLNKNIDYSNAVVTVKERNTGNEIGLTDINFDNRNIGLPNNFEFKVTGLKQNTLYDVHVSNVSVNSVQREYDYQFSLK
ncbi:MAG: hypothetical protein GAK29_00271 [Acinetobacter bereziniae]|uniref:SCP domain-containing protein n=1 Tax=Acinetobacter bereziniae TaxID=106648 RepID=A0A833PI32_ACIBZ|nr:MAG: hypothetical protein GAK29_00271 [Acinetobacter bereziniae]